MTPPDSGERDPGLPCPHGRATWRMCPHCLGLNAPISAATTPVVNESVVVLSNNLAQRILAALEEAYGFVPMAGKELQALAAELRAVMPKGTR